MSSWSNRRRSTLAILGFVVLIGAVGVPLFYFLYKPPTCADGVQNGSEQGVDCGGSCSRLCPNAFLTPIVSWTRYVEIAPNLYNVAAYIANPNPKVKGYAPYKVTLYGSAGVPIASATGMIHIPVGRDTIAFLPSINVGIQKPIKASFEFTAWPEWAKDTDEL